MTENLEPIVVFLNQNATHFLEESILAYLVFYNGNYITKYLSGMDF